MQEDSKFKGMYVEVKQEGNKTTALDNALKKLKRMMKDANVFVLMRENMYYTKPSEIKKNNKHISARRNQRNDEF